MAIPKCGKVTILSLVAAVTVLIVVVYRSLELTPHSYSTTQVSKDTSNKVLQMSTLKHIRGDNMIAQYLPKHIVHLPTITIEPPVKTNVHSKVDLHKHPGQKSNQVQQAHTERVQPSDTRSKVSPMKESNLQPPHQTKSSKQDRAVSPTKSNLPHGQTTSDKQVHAERTQPPGRRINETSNVNTHKLTGQEVTRQTQTGSDAMSIAQSIPRIHPLSFYGKDLCLLYDRKPEYYKDKKLYQHPNVVHYIKLSKSERAIHTDLILLDYVSILSIDKYYKPDKVVIHCNRQPTGKYWEMAQSLSTKIEIRHADRPVAVGRFKKKPIAITHEADILKSSIVYDEGGLVIDFDIVILNGEVVRKQQSISECVIGLERECTFVNAGFLSCVPRTKYIQAWRDSYQNDYHNTWGGYLYNCGELTARTLRECPSCYNMYVDPEVDMNPDAGAPGGPGPGRDPWKEKNGVQWQNKSVAHLLLSHLNLPKDDKILSIKDCSYKEIVRFILGDDFTV